MRSVKSIDELYQEVRNHDVVLCNDAPLATALNNRIDVPRVGGFATTPRHLAVAVAIETLGESPWNDLKIISYISKLTGYDIKFVHGEIENIRTIRRYTKDVKKHLHSITSRRIYEEFIQLPTIEKVMDTFDLEKTELFTGKKVAVIGLDLFDDLDKHFVPHDFDDIEIFGYDDEYEIETIYEIGNDRQIADNAVDFITPENATDIAIVMDVAGPIADAVRSALYRKGIPFKNTLSVKDLAQIRDYLEFVTLGLSYDTIKMKHVRELFSHYGGFVLPSYDEYLLNINYNNMNDGTRLKDLATLMKDIYQMTFEEIREKISTKERPLPQVRILLEDLKLLDSKVTDEHVSVMAYAVNNISNLRHNEQIPEEEKGGVVLIDCSESVFVDRPVVMFLGMGQNWVKSSAGRDYVDWEQEREVGGMKFEALLQQGSVRMYMVNSIKDGKTSRPCIFFDDVFGKIVRRFSDVCKELKKGTWVADTEEVLNKHIPTPLEANPRRFSKSALSSYMTCPKQYMFGQLIKSPDRESTVLGNTVHEFAEFCFCYPEIVAENDMDTYVKMVADKCAGLLSPEARNIDLVRIKVALKGVRKFLSKIPKPLLDKSIKDRRKGNMFMELHSLTLTSSQVECNKHLDTTPLMGELDLFYKGTIFDYKTGKVKELKDIRKELNEDEKPDYIDIQTLAYLALVADELKYDASIKFFFLSDNGASVFRNNDFDVNENMREVRLLNTTKEEFIRNDLKEIVMEKHPEVDGVWNALSEYLIVAGMSDPYEWGKNKDLITRANSMFRKKDKGKSVVNLAAKTMGGKAISAEGILLVTRDMIDEFCEFVRTTNEKMLLERSTEFPSKTDRCEKCGYLSLCMSSGEVEDDESE